MDDILFFNCKYHFLSFFKYASGREGLVCYASHPAAYLHLKPHFFKGRYGIRRIQTFHSPLFRPSYTYTSFGVDEYISHAICFATGADITPPDKP